MSADQTPVVRRMVFTFDLTGTCIYCEKKCNRSRSFYATSMEDAQSQADAAMPNLCHKKCGGY